MRRVWGLAVLLLVLMAAPAAAQSYPFTPPGNPPVDVLPEILERPTESAPAPQPEQVLPVAVENTPAPAPAVAAVETPRPGVAGLALTGGDILGLAGLGGALTLGGAALVRSTRRRRLVTA